jgi:hypothetical protein
MRRLLGLAWLVFVHGLSGPPIQAFRPFPRVLPRAPWRHCRHSRRRTSRSHGRGATRVGLASPATACSIATTVAPSQPSKAAPRRRRLHSPARPVTRMVFTALPRTAWARCNRHPRRHRARRPFRQDLPRVRSRHWRDSRQRTSRSHGRGATRVGLASPATVCS